MIAKEDLYWLAGIVEGEGCFLRPKGYAIIEVTMTDKDVIERVHELFGATSGITFRDLSLKNPKWKGAYRSAVTGYRAIGWMMTLFPLMGSRRQSKIRECIAEWKLTRSRPGRISTYERQRSVELEAQRDLVASRLQLTV